MGLIARLRGLLGSGKGPRFRELRSPGDYRYPLEAIEAAISEMHRADGYWWCTFQSGEVVVQVASNSINTLSTEVDLPGIARGLGLSALADAIPATKDRTLHEAPTASAGELAALVHGVFTGHYGLTDPYELRCELEC